MTDFPIPVELRQRLDLILEACPGPPEGWPQAYAGTLAYTRPGGWSFSFGFPLRNGEALPERIERVAQIIDPEAWETLGYALMGKSTRRDEARAKARDIFALPGGAPRPLAVAHG